MNASVPLPAEPPMTKPALITLKRMLPLSAWAAVASPVHVTVKANSAARMADDYGFTFGGSATDFVGTVSNIRRPSDLNGVYGAAGAGVAVGPGAGAIVLTNQNGAVLRLAGRQAG